MTNNDNVILIKDSDTLNMYLNDDLTNEYQLYFEFKGYTIAIINTYYLGKYTFASRTQSGSMTVALFDRENRYMGSILTDGVYIKHSEV